jgi:hypothetical protein
MNISLLIGTVGALAGVGLGSWLSAQAQRGLLLETRRQAMRQMQLEACVGFLELYRRLNNFVLMEAEKVVLATREYDQQAHGQIHDQTPLFAEANAAEARLRTVISKHSPIRPMADALDMAFEDLATARARYGRGRVPGDLVTCAREAKDHFSQTVYEQLVADQMIGEARLRARSRRTSIALPVRNAKPDAVQKTSS